MLLRPVAQLVAELSTQRVAMNRPGAVISAKAGYTVRSPTDVCLVNWHLKLGANLPVCKWKNVRYCRIGKVATLWNPYSNLNSILTQPSNQAGTPPNRPLKLSAKMSSLCLLNKYFGTRHVASTRIQQTPFDPSYTLKEGRKQCRKPTQAQGDHPCEKPQARLKPATLLLMRWLR